jgi:hypothetical protein
VYLLLGISHDCDITSGIKFSHKQPNPHPLQEVRAVYQALPESWRDLSDWWVGWDRRMYKIDSRDFLLKVAHNVNAIAESITEDLTEFLRHHHQKIRDANRALQNQAADRVS